MTRAAFALLVLAACGGPSFEALTAPPPGKEASLDDEHHRIRLSTGVALAFECKDSQSGDPCGRGRATSEDPGVALILPAWLDTVGADWDKRGLEAVASYSGGPFRPDAVQ